MTFSIIQKSQLDEVQRMDAEYFATNLTFKDYYLGEHVVEFIQYGTSDDLNEDRIGYPTLRLNEFDSYFIKEPEKYCSTINDQEFHNLQLKGGDVLICRTNGNPRLVGKSAIVMENKPYAFASYLFRVRPDIEKISPSTLVTYLHTIYGRGEIEKNMMISNQTNFSPARFRLLRVPKFSKVLQKTIDSLFRSSYKLSNESKFLYQQAEELLLKELGLKDVFFENGLSYIVNFSDVKSVNRIDSEYFQPKYQKLIERIKSQNVKPFAKVVENISAQFNPRPDESYKYVDLGNISSSSGIIDGFEEILGKDAPSRAKRILKKDDIIASSVEGSLDKVALVAESQNGYLASTGFFQFRSNEILPEVLLILTKSIVMQWQMKKHCAGTILTAVPSDALNKMIVPVLPKETQQQITELVRKSHEARKKSKELLEEAKRKVEEMIEGGNRN